MLAVAQPGRIVPGNVMLLALDIPMHSVDVRFRWQSGPVSRITQCLLLTQSGHSRGPAFPTSIQPVSAATILVELAGVAPEDTRLLALGSFGY